MLPRTTRTTASHIASIGFILFLLHELHTGTVPGTVQQEPSELIHAILLCCSVDGQLAAALGASERALGHPVSTVDDAVSSTLVDDVTLWHRCGVG